MVACVTYGAPVCHKAGASMFCHKKLLSIQRVFMLASLPVCRATDALQELLGAMPLDLDVNSRVILHKLMCGLQLAEDKHWLSPSELVDGAVRRYKALLRDEKFVLGPAKISLRLKFLTDGKRFFPCVFA